MPSKAVLMTGCSSGIGHATALLLVREGWTVYATARRTDALSDLEAAGCKTLPLDVTAEESMTAAVNAVVAAEGAVGSKYAVEAISDALRFEVQGAEALDVASLVACAWAT